MHNYTESINLLINRFPVLRPIYEENIYDYEGLPYAFYESIFVKYVMEKIQSSDDSELNRIFMFIEELLLNGDEEMRNLVDVAVIESLYHEDSFNEFYAELL